MLLFLQKEEASISGDNDNLNENPSNEHRTATNETVLISEIPNISDKESLIIAPGKEKVHFLLHVMTIVKNLLSHIYFQFISLVLILKGKLNFLRILVRNF